MKLTLVVRMPRNIPKSGSTCGLPCSDPNLMQTNRPSPSAGTGTPLYVLPALIFTVELYIPRSELMPLSRHFFFVCSPMSEDISLLSARSRVKTLLYCLLGEELRHSLTSAQGWTLLSEDFCSKSSAASSSSCLFNVGLGISLTARSQPSLGPFQTSTKVLIE